MEIKAKIIDSKNKKYTDLIGVTVVITGELVIDQTPFYEVCIDDDTDRKVTVMRSDTLITPNSYNIIRNIVTQRHIATKDCCRLLGLPYNEYLSQEAIRKEVYTVISFILNNFKSEKEAHDYWVERMKSMGWKFGEVTKTSLKQDNQLRSFNSIPTVYQTIDAIKFASTVNSLELIELVERK